MMTRWDMLWLAMGIALTTATQLRVGGGAVGPGETMLAVWLLWMGSRILIVQSHIVTPIVKAVLTFWIVSCVALAGGTVVASSRGVVAADLQHTTMALTLASLFSILFVISISSFQHLKWLLICFTNFTTLALTAAFFLPLPLISPQYGGARFTGWSVNPNQTALALLFIPFFTLYLLQQSRDYVGKLWYAGLTAAAVFIGVATSSDALMIGWLLGALWLVVCGTDRMVTDAVVESEDSAHRSAIHQTLARLFLMFAVIVTLVILYYAFQSLAMEVYDDGGQGSDRLRLWMNGLVAISRSPVVGYGPGSYSGPTAPFLDHEAHNTFIDWTMSSGLLGLMSYVGFLGWIGWKTWRNGSPLLFAAFIAAVGFSSFHYVLRQPLFWFSILAIAESTLFKTVQKKTAKADQGTEPLPELTAIEPFSANGLQR
jgi:O-antigen ligase